MPSSGPNSCGTGTNVTGVGTIGWSNPTNIYTSNDARATINLPTSATSNYLQATNFGFSIPNGSTIDGIEVLIERRKSGTSSANPIDNIIKLVKGNVIGGTNKSAGVNWVNTIDQTFTFGSSSDLWGNTLTVSDVNASDFGVALSVSWVGDKFSPGRPEVDHIQITVHYTTGGGGGGPTNTSALLMVGD